MAARIFLSTITTGGRVTIPARVREHPGIGPGDSLLFTISKGHVTVKSADRLDVGFLELATDSFADWNTPEADEAFLDL